MMHTLAPYSLPVCPVLSTLDNCCSFKPFSLCFRTVIVVVFVSRICYLLQKDMKYGTIAESLSFCGITHVVNSDIVASVHKLQKHNVFIFQF